MSNIKYNVSKTYLLPLISELVGIETKFINNLENTFMFDSNNEFQECFFILHEFSFKNPEFTAYEHRLTKSELFIKHIDIGDKVLYIFKFPQEYLPEYYALQNSKYSEFGDDAKKLILDFWTQMYGKIPAGIREILKIKQILYKDKKLKQQLEDQFSSKNHKIILDENQELGQFVHIDNETYKLNENE